MAKKPVPKDWPRWRIIGAVRETGTNIRQLSIALGYSESVLRQALYRPYPKYERLIAEHIGVTPQGIWPSRYNEDGSRKNGRGERGIHQGNGSTPMDARNSNAVAAEGNLQQAA